MLDLLLFVIKHAVSQSKLGMDRHTLNWFEFVVVGISSLSWGLFSFHSAGPVFKLASVVPKAELQNAPCIAQLFNLS